MTSGNPPVVAVGLKTGASEVGFTTSDGWSSGVDDGLGLEGVGSTMMSGSRPVEPRIGRRGVGWGSGSGDGSGVGFGSGFGSGEGVGWGSDSGDGLG